MSFDRASKLREEARGADRKAEALQRAAERIGECRNHIEKTPIRLGKPPYSSLGSTDDGHPGLGQEEASDAFLSAWRRFGPDLLRVAELELLAQARGERERKRMLDAQLDRLDTALAEIMNEKEEKAND